MMTEQSFYRIVSARGGDEMDYARQTLAEMVLVNLKYKYDLLS